MKNAPDTVRVMTYNIEDVRTTDLSNPQNPRLRKAAATIQRLRPDILLINEMTYDQPGGPGFQEGTEPGRNARRFAEQYLEVAQGEDLEPISYRTFMAPSNTGLSSGFDLNNNADTVRTFPDPGPANPDGSPGPSSAAGRAYGDDAWGFGIFPGQYAMALLVRQDLQIMRDSIRTFQRLPWSSMPDPQIPVDPTSGNPWYTAEEWAQFRLSSKSHWDVPVRLPNGKVLHILASHPTPPAFDGDEQRNVKRNHDEIRFWADYLDRADYIVDDAGRTGGLPEEAPFVLLGDLNADPDEGSALNDPVGTFLLAHDRINGDFVPQATEEGIAAYPDLDPDDTAGWGLRVDYVLPSSNLRVLDGGVARPVGAEASGVPVSDHFPVWLDVVVQE